MKKKIEFLLLLVVLAIFGRLLFFVTINVANDLHFAYKDIFTDQFSIPQTWQISSGSGLGGNETFLMWSRPLIILAGVLGKIGVSFSLTVKAMIFFGFLVLGYLSIKTLLENIGFRKWVSFVGSTFYLANTYIILILDGGQISIALAYALFPIIYLSFLKSIDGSFKDKILAGVLTAVLSFLDIRFVYVFAILVFLRFFYKPSFFFKWMILGIISGVITLGFNFFWILPTLMSYAPGLPASYVRESQTSFLNFTQLKHSFSLLQPHWYENVFGVIMPFKKEFILIPLLAFLAPIFRKKDKNVWFWTVVAIISVFLTKGANPPLPDVYNWLFTHIPGFSLFRDSTKFFFLVALSYSVLIGYTVDEITKRFSKLKVIFPLLVISYFVFLVRPVYLGKMTGTFSEPRYKNEYFSIADKIEEDKTFGRIFWIPSKAPLGFASPIHPAVEASRLESIRPFASATVGTFETQNFIREGNYMGELFDIAGIRYIAYPYFDPKRDDMSKEKVDYYNTFLSQIESLPWIEKKISDIPIPIFKTIENKDKFFLSDNTYFILGSDRIYSEIKNLDGRFSNNALVFVEENPGAIGQIGKAQTTKIVLYDKNISDLTLSFVENNKFISPSALLDFSPDETGWWKREAIDLVWLRDFLQQKYGIDNLDFDYGNSWAIAEGEKELKVASSQIQKRSSLFARIMQSSRGGDINFYQNDQLVGSVDTKIERPEVVTTKLTGNDEVADKFYKYDKADFHWVRIGEIKEDGSLTIVTKGDINIVNSLAIISPEDEKKLNQKVKQLIEEGRVVEWDKLSIIAKKKLLSASNHAKVTYKTLAPTHYKVKVEGLESPTTLFFSETFDSGWELNGQKGYKLYSLINGFWIEKDGEYDLYFTPQKYVVPGLIVSIITLTSCIIILIWRKGKKSRAQLKKFS